jgi:hypothetical protein
MLDGIKLTKQVNGGDVNVSCLSEMYPGGNKFKLKDTLNSRYSGAKPEITIRQNSITIKGSLPYVVNDYNMAPFFISDIKAAFDSLSSQLGVDLSDAKVNYFEFGTTVEIPFPFKDFAFHHLGIDNMDNAFYRKKGKYFQDEVRKIKLYDAGRNAKRILSVATRTELQAAGYYNPKAHYLKFETKYQNPLKSFGREILVSDLQDFQFLSLLTDKLLNTYDDIKKTGFVMPKTDELSSIQILVILLKMYEQEFGCDSKADTFKLLKALPLDYNSRGGRKATITRAFDNLSCDTPNPFDISELLKKAASNFLESA